MSHRIPKVNKLIQHTFADILLKDADLPVDAMVTVARVDTTPNLKSTTIWLYIFPTEREEEVLEMLKGQMYDLQGRLNQELEMRPLPRIYLKADHGAAHSDTINQQLQDISPYEESDKSPE